MIKPSWWEYMIPEISYRIREGIFKNSVHLHLHYVCLASILQCIPSIGTINFQYNQGFAWSSVYNCFEIRNHELHDLWFTINIIGIPRPPPLPAPHHQPNVGNNAWCNMTWLINLSFIYECTKYLYKHFKILKLCYH